jgi:hypothetical protein
VEGAERRRLWRPALPRLHVRQLDLPLIAGSHQQRHIAWVVMFVLVVLPYAVQSCILVIARLHLSRVLVRRGQT